ncbi:hypothetical protein [Sanguibacter sp. 25GB23B1]|uniref:hypothetical protein n=1 Tax=unclassified Sanguibacter TaxID=2645534 RepID=UPI0032AF943F
MTSTETGVDARRRTSRRIAAGACATVAVLTVLAALQPFPAAGPVIVIGELLALVVALVFAVRSAPRSSPGRPSTRAALGGTLVVVGVVAALATVGLTTVL